MPKWKNDKNRKPIILKGARQVGKSYIVKELGEKYFKYYIEINFEREPLQNLALEGQLKAFLHHGFWKPMDTLRDKRELESLWNSVNPPWKVWKD